MDDSSFKSELIYLINKYSKENDSNTPDFILANYIEGCLDNFNKAIYQREEWHGINNNLKRKIL